MNYEDNGDLVIKDHAEYLEDVYETVESIKKLMVQKSKSELLVVDRELLFKSAMLLYLAFENFKGPENSSLEVIQ